MIKLRNLLFPFLQVIILTNTINLLQAQDNIIPSHFISNAKYAYLIDVFRNKMTTPKLLRAAKDFWLKHQYEKFNMLIILTLGILC